LCFEGEKVNKVLPFTEQRKLIGTPKEWSFLYAYNLRTVRDVFVYCNLKKKISSKQLYLDLAANKVHPPKDYWIRRGKKRQERLRLEYIHAAEYLGLIKQTKSEVTSDFSFQKKEKELIVEQNETREFNGSEGASPPFSEQERKAFRSIISRFQRARDYLYWFLDFSKFEDSMSFSIEEFTSISEPIFVLSGNNSGLKGSDLILRCIDRELWSIPSNKPNDYIRLASYVFPSWFKDLGLIDEVIVFPELSKVILPEITSAISPLIGKRGRWCIYFYPIRMSSNEFKKVDLANYLRNKFLKTRSFISVPVPEVVYSIANDFRCPVNVIHQRLALLFKEDFTHFYLDRASLNTLDRSRFRAYEKSFIRVDGFYRSHLKISK